MRRTRPVRPAVLGAALTTGALVLTAAPALAVTGPAAPSGGTTHAYTAKIVVGEHDRGCSGVLVDLQWLLTAASCFAANPAADLTVPAGAPQQKTTATVGHTDATPDGVSREVVELVPYQGRDVVMARLGQPVTGVAPVPVAKTPPAAGDTLQAVGFGRTKTEWAPTRQHAGTFAVDAVEGGTLAVTGQDGDAVCPGDTGGPMLVERGGTAELVGISSRSWQGGCWGVDEAETRTGAVAARVDDLNAWVDRTRSLPQQAQPVSGDFDGDGDADLAAFYDYGKDAQGRFQSGLWVFDSNGTSYGSPRVAWDSSSFGSWSWERSKVVSGDFNGDGKADIGVLYNLGSADGGFRTRLYTFTSTGTSFSAPKLVWDSAGSVSWNWERSKVVSGDYDGDGKADVGVLYDLGAVDGGFRTRLWTFTSTGAAFEAPKVAWDSSSFGSWNWERSKVVSGDYDGDGKADVGVLYDLSSTDGGFRTRLYTFTSTGAAFAAPKTAWDSSSFGSWAWGRSKVVSGDFNGDGKADVGVLYDLGASGSVYRTRLYTFTGNGTSFAAPQTTWDSSTTGSSWNWNLSTPVAGDLTGDGRTDIAVWYEATPGADGRSRHGLWNFTSTGTGMTAPQRDWYSVPQ
ncbi:FG-GAP-like repeat-containing protein [Streptomyces sp. MD20-1-1]|uniref:FG-GAP-like repeat-containing protein n=1 Tax=Streptomyces sp. MD20-1-1 TaxID=3028668 RepID=UPI0029A677F9|nr:FG-GAP-like repeat-containing protein [Streptomyces sp. MD20-1-1]